ncbi:ricin-type beta-trefoil lectin domain protein [Streptomyces antibioticus]|uniref:ricin-type beta-trefoil lectin domain protein n=1 Tax=Streptomyces antibioticus TaxID=1890 RepID=UPI0033FD4CB4
MTPSDVKDTDRHTESDALTHEPLDRELTQSLRAQDGDANSAALELRRRHMGAVLTYARVLTTHQPAADHLALEAFASAVEELRGGVDPLGTWRHHALTHVGETARLWAADSRQEHLRTEFLAWVWTTGAPSATEASHGPPDVMLKTFAQLAEQFRGVLWYSVVDKEADGTVAGYMGIPPRTIPDLTTKAKLALHAAYVQEYLAHHGTTLCQGFRRIIEETTRAGGGRRHPDLVAHLADCTRCTQLLADLTSMSNDPRTALAEGLLTWGGAAYAAIGDTGEPNAAVPDVPDALREEGTPSGNLPIDAVRPPAGAGRATGPAHRSAPRHRALAAILALATVTLVTTVAANTMLDHGRAAGDSPPPRQQSTPTASKSRTPATRIRVGVTAQLVHSDTGLCLDLENGKVQKRTNAVATRCTSSPTQRWTLDSGARLHNMADPDFCLKADGSAAAVGIRPCESDDPEKRSRMTFIVGQDSTIRSRPRPEQAVVPVGTFTGAPVLLALKEPTSVHAGVWTARPAPAT